MMSYFDGIVLIKAMLGANGPVASKDYVNTAIEQLPKGLVYRGAVSYYSDLPSSDVEVGDCYTVLYSGSSGTTLDGTEYAWGPVGGTNQWIGLGPDLSEYRKIVALPSANYRLYACSPGGQTYFEAKNSGTGSTEPNGNEIMIPTEGKLTVGTPTGNYHATTKKYVDNKFYTLELNQNTYNIDTKKLTDDASSALQSAIEAKKPIFYIGPCAGSSNTFDWNYEHTCGFVNYNPVADQDGKYFINIPDEIRYMNQMYGATFDPVTKEFYPNEA